MQNMNNWLTWWRLATLMVLVMVFISMAEPVTSQSSNRNNTLMKLYCSMYRGRSENYLLSNLNTTLSSLRRQLSVNGVRYAVARCLLNGESVWGRASCRDYVSDADCVACFDYAVAQLKACGSGTGAHVVYDDCDVRYENSNFDDKATTRAGFVVCGNTTSPQASDFRKTTKSLLSDLRIAAPKTSNYYAASTRKLSNINVTLYAIAQCNLNLTQSVCKDCLNTRYISLDACLPGTTGRAIDNGCFMRYSTSPFFKENKTTNLLPFLSGGGSGKSGLIIGVRSSAAAFVLILALSLWFWRRRKSKHFDEDMSDLQGTQSYSYENLKKATNNFSEECLIGTGGFGDVYKANLDNGIVVAVKKLQVRVGANKEFVNEAKLITNVRHRNLILQLGWCIDGSELLIVLEYMSQGSLDKFLWGEKKGTLNWKQRSDIISGIARGLAHLHGELHVKIIHRDIKSSNILLDNNFRPKIADFGLARFYPDDQTHVSTRFAGTMGYTAPEYATRGHLSEKVDTYSFGIVALEVISGQRCTHVNYDGPEMEYLLDQAWKFYEKGIHIKLIDESLNPNEYQEANVMKIVEIALMCTQSPASLRPSISEVYLMLSSEPTLRKRQMSRPTFVNADRRIHIGGSRE